MADKHENVKTQKHFLVERQRLRVHMRETASQWFDKSQLLFTFVPLIEVNYEIQQSAIVKKQQKHRDNGFPNKTA